MSEAWQPPCLHSTPEYLAWEFGFPGYAPPVGVAATDMGLEILNLNGAEAVTVVEAVYLAEPDADGLKVLLMDACRRWASPGASAILTVPNLGGVDLSLIDSVGLRRTRSQFEGCLATADPADPLLQAERTNLDIH